MKEYKFNAILYPTRIDPIDSNHVFYREARDEIRSMQSLSAKQNPFVEVIIRVHDPRQDWIDKWYAMAKTSECDGDIFIRHCKETTIVVAYGAVDYHEIACSAPRHGDKYDYKTGIAVAYAKTCHEPIPDFI